MSKIKHIDSLRGVAILLVILIHVGMSTDGTSRMVGFLSKYGQMGVQLFFVVSAFTLCNSMVRRDDENGKYRNYFIRRFVRIAPLYYCGILFYAVYRYHIGYNSHIAQTYSEVYTIQNLLSHIFFLHGFFPPSNNIVVPGGWSIGTEMAFYVCFPFLFQLSVKLKNKGNRYLLLLPFCALMGNLVVLFFIKLFTGFSIHNNNFIYYNLVNQLPVFLLGILLFHWHRAKLTDKHHWGIDILGFIGFNLLSLVFWFKNFPFAFAFVPVVCGISYLFLYNFFAKVNWVNFAFLRRIGQLSFSMYIFHFPFAWEFSAMVYGKFRSQLSSDLLFLICFLLTVLLTFCVAFITEKLIEKPGINFGKFLIRKFRDKPHQETYKGTETYSIKHASSVSTLIE